MKKLFAVLVTAVLCHLAACAKDEGESCDPSGDNDCMSMWSTDGASCIQCPISEGFSEGQGVCSASLDASVSACQAAWSASSPGGSSCGTYDGPDEDPQVDSFCKAAYAHTCDGNAQGVAANCRILGESFGSQYRAACKYCK